MPRTLSVVRLLTLISVTHVWKWVRMLARLCSLHRIHQSSRLCVGWVHTFNQIWLTISQILIFLKIPLYRDLNQTYFDSEDRIQVRQRIRTRRPPAETTTFIKCIHHCDSSPNVFRTVLLIAWSVVRSIIFHKLSSKVPVSISKNWHLWPLSDDCNVPTQLTFSFGCASGQMRFIDFEN